MTKDFRSISSSLLIIIFIAIIAFFQIKYRFTHPEQTETQLFLNFFEAFQ
jgi:hypothetical protein